MKFAINKSIVTLVFYIYMFNIAKFSVVVRKCNGVFSLFFVAGK
jgi:hypothetical protein